MSSSVFIVGLGNIGSQVVPLLAAVPGMEHVGLIDFDRYEAGNLGCQRIVPRHVGPAKAKLQARVLRAFRPDLAVTAHVCRFEDMPLGLLRESIILSCVDSRAARQSINRAAFALGSPWIDAAVDREGSVRARAFLPGRSACLECGWGPRDYQLLEQRLPCITADPAPSATQSPLEFGAIAAGLQVSLLRRLNSDPSAAEALADRQWFVDVPSGRGWTGKYASNPECRLDHRRWDITVLGAGSIGVCLREALALAGPEAGENSLAVPGRVFLRRLRCPKCRLVRRLHCRLPSRLVPHRCKRCGATLLVAAIDAETQLSARNASAAVLREPLARRGLVAGDLVAVRSAGTTRHFQLA